MQTSVKKRSAAQLNGDAPAEKRKHDEVEERKKAMLIERSEKIHKCAQIGVCALLIEKSSCREREERHEEAYMRKAMLDAMSPALRNQVRISLSLALSRVSSRYAKISL